jgi:hypothetical protein
MPSSRAMIAAWQVRPAAVGDDRARPLHHRLPVRVGHVGDEDVAGLDLVHVGDRVDDAHRAGADLLADRSALDETVPLPFRR